MISPIIMPNNITTPYYGMAPDVACSESIQSIHGKNILPDFNLPSISSLIPTPASSSEKTHALPAASQNYLGQSCSVSCPIACGSVNYQ